MKSDKYLKIILTIIAICLVWICVRDFEIGGKHLFAGVNGGAGEQEVYITGGTIDNIGEIGEITRFNINALMLCEPIQVEVVNLPMSSPIIQEEKK